MDFFCLPLKKQIKQSDFRSKISQIEDVERRLEIIEENVKEFIEDIELKLSQNKTKLESNSLSVSNKFYYTQQNVKIEQQIISAINVTLEIQDAIGMAKRATVSLEFIPNHINRDDNSLEILMSRLDIESIQNELNNKLKRVSEYMSHFIINPSVRAVAMDKDGD